MVPYEIGMRFAAIPVGFHGDHIRVAFADPSDKNARPAIKAHIAAYDCAVAELSDIEMGLRTVHRRNAESFQPGTPRPATPLGSNGGRMAAARNALPLRSPSK